MKNIKLFLLAFALLWGALACADAGDDEYYYEDEAPAEETYSDPEESVATEEDMPEDVVSEDVVEGAVCVDVTGQIMQTLEDGGASTEEYADESVTVFEETPLVTYEVSGDQIANPSLEDVPAELEEQQSDEVTQEQIWEYYAALIPADRRNNIVQYSIFTDGVDNTLAMVSQTTTDPYTWALQVDIADTANYYSLTYTLIHEYGHLLTLGPDQVTPSEAVFNDPENVDILNEEANACPDYFPGEGCSMPDSYINAFYNEFWTEIADENMEISYEEDPDVNQELLTAFYEKYQDQFVTEYAATNPEEDITESWTFFVLNDKPAGDSIAEQKVLFFYNYPELVELRSVILSNLCTAFPK